MIATDFKNKTYSTDTKRLLNFLYLFCLSTFLTVFFLASFAGSVDAVTIKNFEDLHLDVSLNREDNNFRKPERIVVTPVFLYDNDLEVSDEELFRGIYYYTVEKLGFTDIPFHYLVSKTGQVVNGNSGGEERLIAVEGIGTDMITVAYFADPVQTKFDPKAERELTELLTKIANENEINPSKIEVKGIRFVRDVANKSVKLQTDDLFGIWNSSLESIKSVVAANYSPIPKVYSVKVNGIEAPESVKAGQEITIKLNLSNKGSKGIYGGTSDEMVATKVDGGASVFFVNNEWYSTTQFGVLSDDQILQPFSDGSTEVRLRVPLVIGQVSETYELRTLNGTSFNSGTFNISLNVTAPDYRIIEIGSTETGNLNVRTEASSAASIVSEVSTGQRFLQTGDAGNGWIEIQLQNGQKGWIASWYTFYPY